MVTEDEDENQQHEPWVHGALLPVRVILRDFSARGLPAAGETACADNLWRFIEQELKNSGLCDFAPHLHAGLLERGGASLRNFFERNMVYGTSGNAHFHPHFRFSELAFGGHKQVSGSPST